MASGMQRTTSTGLGARPRGRNQGEREVMSAQAASTISSSRRRSNYPLGL
jgi:hypothetical protein